MPQEGSSPKVMALLPEKGRSILVPLRSPQAAAAKKVADGAGGRKLGIPGVENHAEVFGDDGGLSAVLHLQQGRGEASEELQLGSPVGLSHPWCPEVSTPRVPQGPQAPG